MYYVSLKLENQIPVVLHKGLDIDSHYMKCHLSVSSYAMLDNDPDKGHQECQSWLRIGSDLPQMG